MLDLSFLAAAGTGGFPYQAVTRIQTQIHLLGKEGISIQEQKGERKPYGKTSKDVNRYPDFD